MANPSNKLVLNLVGGMNVKVGPLIAKDDECELALNYVLDTIGCLQKRGGSDAFGGQPVPNKSILGLFNFYDTSSNVNIPVMAINNAGASASVIYYLNSGTWTISDKTNSTASARTRFVAFVDYVFRVNGADLVATSNNGLNWGTTYAPTSITPRYAKVFQDRVYFANGASGNNSRVWFSSLPSGGAVTWDLTANYFDVNPDDGDQITALENNGNRLLIFKKRALYRWNFGQVEPDRVIGVGTDSQESVATNFDLGVTFFANQRGVYTYTGNRPKLISRKIQPYITAVQDWSTVAGGVDSEHYYLHVGDITVGDRTIENCVLVYHISLDAWTVFSVASSITVFSTLIDVGNGEQLCFGDTSGLTQLTSYSLIPADEDEPYTSDNDTPINADFISKEYLLSFPDRTNLAWIDVFARVRGNSMVYYDIDRMDQFQELQSPLTQRITNIRIPDRECNSVRIRITDVGASASQLSSTIEGFNMEHDRKTKRDEPQYRTKKPGYG